MKKQYFIGIASSFHDPSIAIVDEEGRVLFAESTERYLQNKRAIGCPADPYLWIEQVLGEYCETGSEFHLATTWSRPHVKRLQWLGLLGLAGRSKSSLFRYVSEGVFKTAIPGVERDWYLRMHYAGNHQSGSTIERHLYTRAHAASVRWHSFDHHLCHAAAACYGSGFAEALCLIADGTGERGTVSTYRFSENAITPLSTHKGLESLGAFYSTLTELCGFDPIRGEEWKVMGLAAFGKKDETFYNTLRSFFEVVDCSLKQARSYETIRRDFARIGEQLKQTPGFQRRADLAFTGQLVFSEWMTQLLQNLHAKGGSENLVFAGGCALNSSFNGTITRNTGFKKLYVPSAPGDDGASLGAAWLAYNKSARASFPGARTQCSPYLGSAISNEEMERYIRYSGIRNFQRVPDTVCRIAAEKLAQGKIVGWIQGRAEFGPRALGNRSILADPRSAAVKQRLNDEVKFREEFRPFAPAILPGFGNDYFEAYEDSPYMERTLKFREPVIQKVPAVVHADGTGRLQSVRQEWNPRFYELIRCFHEITGIPMVLNTSFNVMGKPMVHGFNDALQVFQNSGMEVLVVNDFVFEKD